jgi:pyrroloquinoline quinone (PQQ) biosynthesis protein C
MQRSPSGQHDHKEDLSMESALREIRQTTLARVLETPIAARIAAGDANREQYAAYLVNVYNYAQHSPRVIALAGSRCAGAHPELANYLFRHASEELGHEKWALGDLRSLGFEEDQIKASRPTPSCAAMVGLEYFVAGHSNPVGLFGWLYALEALGDDIAHAVANQVAAKLSAGANAAVAFLRGHGDADHEHARAIEDHVLRYVTTPDDRADVLHVARLSSEFYVRMLHEASAGSAR